MALFVPFHSDIVAAEQERWKGGTDSGVLRFLYSLTGVAMAYWVAAVPGNTPGHVRLNFVVRVPAAVVTFGLVLSFAGQLFG